MKHNTEQDVGRAHRVLSSDAGGLNEEKEEENTMNSKSKGMFNNY